MVKLAYFSFFMTHNMQVCSSVIERTHTLNWQPVVPYTRQEDKNNFPHSMWFWVNPTSLKSKYGLYAIANYVIQVQAMRPHTKLKICVWISLVTSQILKPLQQLFQMRCPSGSSRPAGADLVVKVVYRALGFHRPVQPHLCAALPSYPSNCHVSSGGLVSFRHPSCEHVQGQRL